MMPRRFDSTLLMFFKAPRRLSPAIPAPTLYLPEAAAGKGEKPGKPDCQFRVLSNQMAIGNVCTALLKLAAELNPMLVMVICA